MARKTQQRSLKQPEITIIGEGATERFYFTNLRRLKGYRYTCKPRNFTEQSLDEIQKQVDRVLADHRLETAIQRAQAFGTEGESYSNLPKAFEVIEEK